MTIRLRLTLLVAVAVAVSVAAASAIVYVVVRSDLKDEVDRTLQDRVALAERRPGPQIGLPPGPPVLAFGGYVQFVRLGGPPPALVLPGQERAERVAAGESGPFFAEGHVNGTHVRVFAAPLGPGTAVQAMRSLEEVDRSLRTIGLALLAIGLGGIAVAAALGLFVAQTALAPVRRLTDLAEEVTHTRDLTRRVQASGSDELSRLGASLNAMLDALEESMAVQRRLVADASHELRTPLASLRTNVEVLAGGKRLDSRERARLLADVVGQIEELSLLVADLVEIDRDGRDPELEDVRLDELVLASTGPSPTSSTMRPSGALRAGRSRSASRRRRSPCGTMARGSPPRISPTSSIASTARPRRASSPGRASGSRSPGRWPRPTAGPRLRRTYRAAARSSGSGFRPQPTLNFGSASLCGTRDKEGPLTRKPAPTPTPAQAKELLEQALFEIRRVIAGQDVMLERVLVCLLTGGHLLIEGVPGLAKTLTVKTTARVLGGTFKRVQFTPDLVPSDLVGTRIYRPDTGSFETELGPVFCNFLLADEINRAPAKVQSALLEVMQERQVTIGHDTHPVPDPFLVMATQNPIESEGTYPLPEAQVDRFMLKILVDYPEHDEELTVVHRSLEAVPELEQAVSLDHLRALQELVSQAYVDPGIVSYAVTLATATRKPADFGVPDVQPYVAFGASPRGPISLVQAARALALLRGRDYVRVQDIGDLVKDAFRHRLVLTYQALAEERSADSVLDAVIAAVPVPQLDLSRAIA